MKCKNVILCSYLAEYKSLEILESRCLCIAIIHFVLYLVLYITLSFLSTLMQFADNADAEKLFIAKFEKYFVLASALFMLAPFMSSSMMIFGLLNRNNYCIRICLKCSGVCSIVFCVSLLSIGIFLCIKGTIYVASTSISIALILGAFMTYSQLQIFELLKARELNDPQKRMSDISSKSTNSTTQTIRF